MGALLDWLSARPGLVTTITIVSIVLGVASVLAVPFLVGRIPVDYFAQPDKRPAAFAAHHPVLRVTLLVLKNLLGLLLLVLGVLLVFTPGQGLVTIFVGLLLIDGPGKRRLELFIVRRRSVRRTLDWLRRRRGLPPLEVWDPDGDAARSGRDSS